MISASHNPYEDNGIKVFSQDGTKLTDEIEERIERRIAELLPAGAEATIDPCRTLDVSRAGDIVARAGMKNFYLGSLSRRALAEGRSALSPIAQMER